MITTTNPAHQPRILVVDDMPEYRALILQLFKDKKWVFEEAENGLAAFELFQGTRYELVLMDLEMPILDGLATIEKIRQYENSHSLEKTPIIVISSSASENNKRLAKQYGCDDFIEKPATRDRLQAVFDLYIG